MATPNEINAWYDNFMKNNMRDMGINLYNPRDVERLRVPTQDGKATEPLFKDGFKNTNADKERLYNSAKAGVLFAFHKENNKPYQITEKDVKSCDKEDERKKKNVPLSKKIGYRAVKTAWALPRFGLGLAGRLFNLFTLGIFKNQIKSIGRGLDMMTGSWSERLFSVKAQRREREQRIGLGERIGNFLTLGTYKKEKIAEINKQRDYENIRKAMRENLAQEKEEWQKISEEEIKKNEEEKDKSKVEKEIEATEKKIEDINNLENELDQNEIENELDQNEIENELDQNEIENELDQNEIENELDQNEIENELDQNEVENNLDQNEIENELDQNEVENNLEQNEREEEIDPNQPEEEIDPNQPEEELDPNQREEELDQNQREEELDQNQREEEIATDEVKEEIDPEHEMVQENIEIHPTEQEVNDRENEPEQKVAEGEIENQGGNHGDDNQTPAERGKEMKSKLLLQYEEMRMAFAPEGGGFEKAVNLAQNMNQLIERLKNDSEALKAIGMKEENFKKLSNMCTNMKMVYKEGLEAKVELMKAGTQDISPEKRKQCICQVQLMNMVERAMVGSAYAAYQKNGRQPGMDLAKLKDSKIVDMMYREPERFKQKLYDGIQKLDSTKKLEQMPEQELSEFISEPGKARKALTDDIRKVGDIAKEEQQKQLRMQKQHMERESQQRQKQNEKQQDEQQLGFHNI